jgi:hypothetical protein
MTLELARHDSIDSGQRRGKTLPPVLPLPFFKDLLDLLSQ